MTRAFYVPSAQHIIDIERSPGSGITAISGEALEAVQRHHPGVIAGTSLVDIATRVRALLAPRADPHVRPIPKDWMLRHS